MTHQPSLSRRHLLKTFGLLGAGAAIAACAPPPSAPPAPASTAAPAGGTEAPAPAQANVTLRMLTQAGADYEAAFRAWSQQYGADSGATVEFEFAPWETLMPKVQADLASGSPQFDLFCNDIEFQYTIWPELEPINDFITASGYDTKGFFNPIYKFGEGIAGNTGVRYGLPVVSGVSLIFYRTDLISELPTTWDAYDAMLGAQTIDGRHGLSFAGVTAQLVKIFLARYWSQGDPLLTPDWKPLINSEKGVAALTRLKDEMTNYSPPGILAWDNPDAANAFVAGDVAVYEGWGGFILPNLDDPAKSKVVGNWAIGPYPENGTGNFVQHNIVMMKKAANKQAAFDLMAFLSNAQHAKIGALDFGMTPARKSVFTDADVVKAKPYMPDYANVLDRARPFTPGVPQWLQMFIAVGEGVSATLSDQASPKDALDNLAKLWEELIAQNPLSFAYTE